MTSFYILWGNQFPPQTFFLHRKIWNILNLKSSPKPPIMDEKSSKEAPPRYEHVAQVNKTELDEAANPDAPEHRQAIGINIVQNPLMVNLQLKPPVFGSHVKHGS